MFAPCSLLPLMSLILHACTREGGWNVTCQTTARLKSEVQLCRQRQFVTHRGDGIHVPGQCPLMDPQKSASQNGRYWRYCGIGGCVHTLILGLLNNTAELL
uniref:Secreted protein n=1 Tax=Eutreptiella gymnastica TaxID=73025 RepID=A0A7S1J5K1_9EUGL